MNMIKKIAALTVIAAALVATGCTTHLSHGQKRELDAYKEKGFYQQEKQVGLAAGLGILPIVGYAYSGHPILAVTTLPLYPFLGPLWMPYDTAQAALNRNFYATKEYVAREKAKALKEIDRQMEDKTLSYEQHIRQQREIEDKYASY